MSGQFAQQQNKSEEIDQQILYIKGEINNDKFKIKISRPFCLDILRVRLLT